MVLAVDQRHAHGRALQRARGGQAAEAAADDDDVRHAGTPAAEDTM